MYASIKKIFDDGFAWFLKESHVSKSQGVWSSRAGCLEVLRNEATHWKF